MNHEKESVITHIRKRKEEAVFSFYLVTKRGASKEQACMMAGEDREVYQIREVRVFKGEHLMWHPSAVGRKQS